MFLKLIWLIFQRGIGSVIYVVVAAWYLPSKAIIENIYLLTIFEFIFGMILPTLRTSILSGKIDAADTKIIALFIVIIFEMVILMVGGTLSSILIATATIFMFPFLIVRTANLERRKISRALEFDAYSATLGAILASCLLIGFEFLDISDNMSSPILRGGCAVMILSLLLLREPTEKSLINKNFNIKLIMRVIPGMDYLTALSIFRASLLDNLGNLTSGGSLVKFIVLVYEPLSSLTGYYLRGKFSHADFYSKKYFTSTKQFFLVIFLLCLALSVLTVTEVFNGVMSVNTAAPFNQNILIEHHVNLQNPYDHMLIHKYIKAIYLESYIYALSVILLFLGLAGFTTHSIIGSSKVRHFLIISLVLSAFLMTTGFNLMNVIIVVSITFIGSIQLHYNSSQKIKH